MWDTLYMAQSEHPEPPCLCSTNYKLSFLTFGDRWERGWVEPGTTDGFSNRKWILHTILEGKNSSRAQNAISTSNFTNLCILYLMQRNVHDMRYLWGRKTDTVGGIRGHFMTSKQVRNWKGTARIRPVLSRNKVYKVPFLMFQYSTSYKQVYACRTRTFSKEAIRD